MFSFKNDYAEGCHPEMLKMLIDTNMSQQEGYGDDEYSDLARTRILQHLQLDADIHFVSGGTQANTVVLAAALKPFESVIAAESAHINVHEAGAIEATGHKIEYAATPDGKLTPELIAPLLLKAEDHHMVKPRLVYISQSTELGTVYKLPEMEALSAFCKKNNLLLYADGARMGAALTSPAADFTLADMARLFDAFYIGGTKNGALLGEAIVLLNRDLKRDFLFHLKQRGALLSKGRLAGTQFAALFNDDLFFDLARHANRMALKMAAAIESQGFPFFAQPESNQIFPILPMSLIEKLSKEFGFYIWRKTDAEHAIIRLVTSWATPESEVERFIECIQ
ncbi:MAG: threonine aldolase [Bacteroidetes bacterium GWF2_43_63]|nr:MAG: threonine aldolase [Bacteroidetes bacterium GWE2_42_42]OFY55517.1 MAG: threonine aldolase [Bacteroidetes bacterium GWF2_43_63]HBG69998.1 threonine aldolase [Bacteroidales bacterium]HCB62577.1 threonine aldolase [Bacteroidales bacterium]HCY23697.1 threonine aldolase [Bacteroidales bacterium]